MKQLTTFFAILFIFVACTDSGTLKPENSQFGTQYSLVTEGEVPFIREDTLVAEVTYSGCNGGHEFDLISQSTSSPAQLWLYKVTPNQDCEAFFRERKSFPLIQSMRQADDIQMLAPDGSRVTLR